MSEQLLSTGPMPYLRTRVSEAGVVIGLAYACNCASCPRLDLDDWGRCKRRATHSGDCTDQHAKLRAAREMAILADREASIMERRMREGGDA